MNGPRPPLRRRLSLRARMILASAAVVALVLVTGGLLLVTAIRATLVDSMIEVGQIRAADVAAQVRAGLPPGTPPVLDDLEAYVQVVQDGRVRSASAPLSGVGTLDLPQQSPGTTAVHLVEQLPVEASGPFYVVARGVQPPAAPATVFVVVSTEDVDDVLAVASHVGLIGLPVLVLALSGAMWVVLGRTLAPVEAIRAQAAAISGTSLERRVPLPVQHDEIGRLARTVNAMLDRLQASVEQQRRFVADAAHELRSPVASLRTQIETARAPRRVVDADALLRDLLHDTLRMERLVDELLVLARMEAGAVPPRLGAVDLDDAVDAATGPFAAGTRPRLDLSGVEPVQVTGDRDMLERAVRNLIENARRHARSTVRVTLSGSHGAAVLVVEDDGPGIPPGRREEVFHPFTRLDPARARNHGGIGLGLTIVANIVRAHAGTVEVDDSPLGGARFRVQLPMVGPGSVPAPAPTRGGP